MSRQNPNMNAYYSFRIIRGVLVIFSTNKNEGKTVTNDMERILKEIKQACQGRIPEKIIYEDSEGLFDQVVLTDGKVTFAPIRETSAEAALDKLLGIEIGSIQVDMEYKGGAA